MENKSRFETATPLSEKETKQGDCDTCGKWDSNLIEGMCGECRKRYLKGEGN